MKKQDMRRSGSTLLCLARTKSTEADATFFCQEVLETNPCKRSQDPHFRFEHLCVPTYVPALPRQRCKYLAGRGARRVCCHAMMRCQPGAKTFRFLSQSCDWVLSFCELVMPCGYARAQSHVALRAALPASCASLEALALAAAELVGPLVLLTCEVLPDC